MSDEPIVFVVDDDRASADSMAALISSIGLKAVTYDSAERFLDQFDGNRHGCLVLDVRLKGMNGFELLETLAANEIRIPTVVISGHADLETRRQADSYGVVAFFGKPFRPEEFCETLCKSLGRAGSPN